MEFQDTLCLGVAGNFARHLEQAGELKDFENVKIEEEGAPKGIFPFYLPKSEGFLNVYPLSSSELILRGNQTAQVEPEVGIYCEVVYDENKKVIDLKPLKFGAVNDCTIRKEGATKISQKKNWGEASKGASKTWIDIDKFENEGIMDKYRLASFVRRDGVLYSYGEDSPLLGYSYFYGKLKRWLIEKINTQQDQDPLENISKILEANENPRKILISIGATAYAEFGEKNFLESGDKIYVVVYKEKIENIKEYIEKEEEPKNSSLLIQEVK
ncbi:MAG: DUF5718 family protein [Campylobacterales bacterium]|nr:DUF5718 family protein [Campylobacterales bacterium]